MSPNENMARQYWKYLNLNDSIKGNILDDEMSKWNERHVEHAWITLHTFI